MIRTKLQALWTAGVAGTCLLAGLAEAQVVRLDEVSVGTRRVEVAWSRHPADTVTVDERLANPNRAFCGYRLWRTQEGGAEGFQLLRSYSLLDTTWTFRGNVREFADPDSIHPRGTELNPDQEPGESVPGPFNGFAYRYSITWFEASLDTSVTPVVSTFYEMQEVEVGAMEEFVYPSDDPVVLTPLLASVRVVPNPYNPAGEFGKQAFPGAPRIQFVNLPISAQVDVYTLSGDKVVSLDHQDADDSLDWDLKNTDGRDVSSGTYVFSVVATTGERTMGRFVVIR